MPRPMWKGAVSFGMVTIPVRLYVATESHSVTFRQLCSQHLSPVRNRRWCEQGDHEVAWAEISKGYEVSRDRYVLIDDSALENLPLPAAHAIEINEFVPATSFSQGLYFKSAYYVEPDDIGRKPYQLLLQALAETDMVAVAKIALRDREHLCTLQPAAGLLVLSTLHWPEEIRPTSELRGTSAEATEISPRELKMAKSLISSLAEERFDPSRYHDDYRQALMRVVEAKVAGEEVLEQPAAAAEPKVMDLMEALQASVDRARQKRVTRKPATRPARRAG